MPLQKPNGFNNSLGNSPKVDGVIIYSLMKLTNAAAQPYNTQTERKYKYYLMRDIITTTINPYLVPKISKEKWASRYKTLMKKLEEVEKLESNLEYFNYILVEMMQLITTVLYSNNYYMLEDYNDEEYMEALTYGAVTSGN